MVRTYEFYERKLGLAKYEVDKIEAILNEIKNGTFTENEVRSLGSNGLKYCICESKFDLFKQLVSPFAYNDGKNVRYKYLLDAISLGLVEFINDCPSSIMEHWAQANKDAKTNAECLGEEFFPIPVEFTSKDAVVLYPSLKKELLDAIYKVDKKKIFSIKIKDVLPRQISGMGHPIRDVRDVLYYHETPLIFAGLDLFKKNIITTANDTQGCYDDSKDLPAELNLNIDYESLDEGNKVVAEALVESGNAVYQDKSFVGNGKGVIITIPCSREESVYSVNKRLMEIISKFHKQDMIFGEISVDEIYDVMCRWYFLLSEDDKNEVYAILDNGYTSENVSKALNYFKFLSYYYDEEEGKFWESYFYYDRHKQYLEDKCEFGSQGLK